MRVCHTHRKWYMLLTCDIFVAAWHALSWVCCIHHSTAWHALPWVCCIHHSSMGVLYPHDSTAWHARPWVCIHRNTSCSDVCVSPAHTCVCVLHMLKGEHVYAQGFPEHLTTHPTQLLPPCLSANIHRTLPLSLDCGSCIAVRSTTSTVCCCSFVGGLFRPTTFFSCGLPSGEAFIHISTTWSFCGTLQILKMMSILFLPDTSTATQFLLFFYSIIIFFYNIRTRTITFSWELADE